MVQVFQVQWVAGTIQQINFASYCNNFGELLSRNRQLEEANDLLRAESDTAARLRKSHTEMAKSMSQLESLNRELQERSRAADGGKSQLEKELLLLQSTLDSERRNCSLGSEEIRELQGATCH